MNTIVYRISKYFWKESFYGMVWYAMLCYPMLWYGMESMICYEISMLSYEISMLCYAMAYVVKDKHSATVTQTLWQAFDSRAVTTNTWSNDVTWIRTPDPPHGDRKLHVILRCKSNTYIVTQIQYNVMITMLNEICKWNKELFCTSYYRKSFEKKMIW